MSMEEIDMIIKLKPKNQWVRAKSKEELAEKIKEELSIIPGIDYEFTQPIEMRFNELITGVRADIAVKIFGEDLDYLATKAQEIEKLIRDVPFSGLLGFPLESLNPRILSFPNPSPFWFFANPPTLCLLNQNSEVRSQNSEVRIQNFVSFSSPYE